MTSLRVTYGLQVPLALAAVLGVLLAATAAPQPAAAQSDEDDTHEVDIAVEEIDNIEIGGDVEINIEDPEYSDEGGDEWKEADEEVGLTIETNSSSRQVDINASAEASDPDVEKGDFGLEVEFENFERVQAERTITEVGDGFDEGELISSIPAALDGELTYMGKVSVDFPADGSVTVTVEYIMTDD